MWADLQTRFHFFNPLLFIRLLYLQNPVIHHNLAQLGLENFILRPNQNKTNKKIETKQ